MINPIIFRLGKNKNWHNKIIEKKTIELKNYTFRKSQLITYVYIYFKKYKLLINNLVIYYKKQFLNIFVNYNISNYNFIYKTNFLKIKIIKKLKLNNKNNKLSLFNFNLKKLKQYLIYSYIKKFNKYRYHRFLITLDLKRLNIFKFIDFIKFKYVNLTLNFYFNNFINKFFYSLFLFFNRIRILKITLKQTINNYSYKNFKAVKKSTLFNLILNLRKFEKFNFFYNLFNFLVSLVKLNFKTKIITSFLACKLANIKKWYYIKKFLKFFETILFNYFMQQEKCLKIKIILKGIFIKNKRSSTQTIKTNGNINKSLINQNLDYYQNTCFTNKGTLGIKVFFSEK